MRNTQLAQSIKPLFEYNSLAGWIKAIANMTTCCMLSLIGLLSEYDHWKYSTKNIAALLAALKQ